MASEDVVQEHPHRRIVRIGDTVRRPVQPWTATVHSLLQHLEAVGFPYAPRVLGFDEQGREVLSFVEGESGPAGWAKVVDDRGLSAFAQLLRDYHDATSDFSPPAGAAWAVAPGGGPIDGEVICHGDFGPWNVVWQGHRPVGIIDWDFARPAARLHDVSYALEYVSPFRDDAECLRWLRFPEPPERRRRLELFCAAYGLSSATGMVDAVIARQQENIELVRRLAGEGHEPQATWVADGLLQELDARVALEPGEPLAVRALTHVQPTRPTNDISPDPLPADDDDPVGQQLLRRHPTAYEPAASADLRDVDHKRGGGSSFARTDCRDLLTPPTNSHARRLRSSGTTSKRTSTPG